jgi:hypothetical protein
MQTTGTPTRCADAQIAAAWRDATATEAAARRNGKSEDGAKASAYYMAVSCLIRDLKRAAAALEGHTYRECTGLLYIEVDGVICGMEPDDYQGRVTWALRQAWIGGSDRYDCAWLDRDALEIAACAAIDADAREAA